MANPPDRIEIVGVHPVRPSDDEFAEALELLYGSKLSNDELAQARKDVREHFAGLYLIELEIQPPDAEFDWGVFTQTMQDRPRANWQAAYDEQAVDEDAGRWVFFFHCLDLGRPMVTPLGEQRLPAPTPVPARLASIKYEVP